MSGGKLCISVIEAKNVLAADTASDLSFYVKLRLGHSEVKTDTCFSNSSPKFLKDVRMAVPVPETDILRVEMLQLGPRGDLVVGSTEVRVLSLVNKGTVVQWLELKAFNQSVGAQLCCVLRYLSAESNRPMTPSYTIATREARERAVGAATAATQGALQAPGPAAARALFSDSEPGTSIPGSKPSKPATPAPAFAGPAPAMPAAPAPATPAASAPPPKPQETPTQSWSAAADATATVSTTNASTAATTAEGSSGAEPGGSALTPWQRRLAGYNSVPLPLAVASGMLFGVVAYVLKRRGTARDVYDDEGVCLVSSCFNKSKYEYFKHRLENGLEG